MKSGLMFIAGLAIGAGVSWVYHKNKYEQMVQEEIDDLREHAKEKKNETITKEPENTPEVEPVRDKEGIKQVEEVIVKNNYVSKDYTIDTRGGFIITPDEFASTVGFDTDTFYYHHNDIISNDSNEIMDDMTIRQLLGLTPLQIKQQFGVYDDDSVYIRNEALKCDYEILREEDDYIRNDGR